MRSPGKPRLLVVGADGLIGSALERRLGEAGRFEVWGTTRTRESAGSGNRLYLDLRAPEDFDLSTGFDVAVICAGIGGEAACAADPDGSRQVNVTGQVRLADRLVASGSHVLALSSNAVFDGSRELFSTADPPAPRTEYGRQKRDLEVALQALPGVGILRLTKVLDVSTGLPARWDRELEAGNAVEAFDNHFISPLAPEEVASVLLGLIDRRATGLFQFSGAESLSFHAYAMRRYADRPDLLARIRPARDPAAGDGVLYNSLRTELPTEEGQYEDLKGVGAQALGLMTGYAYATNPKRLAFTLSRYKFVAKMLTGKTSVLEIGCADAFGTPLVLQEVGALTAADFDWMFVREAQVSHPFRDRITFLRHDRGLRGGHTVPGVPGLRVRDLQGGPRELQDRRGPARLHAEILQQCLPLLDERRGGAHGLCAHGPLPFRHRLRQAARALRRGRLSLARLAGHGAGPLL